MNILFVSISSLPNLSGHSISLDVLHQLKKQGHSVYVVCSIEKRENKDTCLCEEAGCQVLRVKIGNNKKASIIEKGLTTLLLPTYYKKAIKKYFKGVKFDLVIYPTPPVTHVSTVRYVKKRDGAKSYLLLKDIFPQNAVDIGMMTKKGVKGLIYKYFRKVEKKLYAISDRIGCMSPANKEYLLKHNPEIPADKVEIFPNCIEPQDMRIDENTRLQLREKYDIPLDKKVFIYGGNLGKPQGIPFLIECLKAQASNDKAYFLIVGDGTEYNKLKIYIESSGQTNAKLIKRLLKEDYDRLVASCDVGMIFLDYRFTIPNFPSRLLGYMQAGLPVIACTDPNTDIGKVIVDNKFGWACESNDVLAFSKCIDKAVLTDLQSLKQNSYDCLLKDYVVEKHVQKLEF